MKLKMHQCPKIDEPQIDITYNQLTRSLESLISYINQCQMTIIGIKDGRRYMIALTDILYLEVIDKKTFIYNQDEVYESVKSLLILEKKLIKTTFCRINRTTLLNTQALNNVKPYPNHRLLVALLNGEQLVVSRKYKQQLYEKIRSEYDD